MKEDKKGMQDIDEMIGQLIRMKIVGEDKSVTFSHEAKQLISEISEKCRTTTAIVDNNL